MSPADSWAVWLGLTGVLFAVALGAMEWYDQHEADRRDARRRNQAHKPRRWNR